MMILADFSKAFDTICFRNLITKMSKLGFSRDFLIWTLNYVTHRKQFVQIDDTCSEIKNVNFGVPQGSILGPVLFNIYVADLQENVNVKCFQYADDTTIYDHAKISDLNNCRNTIFQSINKLSVWSKESTLAFNNDKTKVMILSTRKCPEYITLTSMILTSQSVDLVNYLEFTSMNILSGMITSSTRYLDATPLYRY